MRKFEEKTASWSRHRRQTLLMRLVSLTLCFALFVSSTGMALIGEGEQQDSVDITATDVVPDGDTGTGAGGDALPGDTGDGSDAGTGDGSGDGSSTGEIPGGDTGENPGGDAGENPGGEPVDPGIGENPPVDNTAEIAATLERFNAALDAFRADYTYELSNHGIDGHVCRWTQFEMALNLATAVKTSVSELIANDAAVLSGLDETNAMLSVCAAGAYESRANAVLARTDYTGMTQFDADVARVDSLLKYMLDAELNSGVITGLQADLTQMRVDLAAALEGGSGGTGEPENPDNPDNPENPDNPDNPENPDADAILAIAAAYEALNAGWQAMSFDAVLAEIGRIQVMIGALSDAGKADINIVTVGEYLLTIQSAAAVAELGARVAALQLEDLAAPGLADRINDAKALVGYMTATDAASDAVAGRLAALDAILEALNAPVVSDTGKKFVADVAALKGVFDNARLHAMSKQVKALQESYGLLVETDKADASVIAALAELDALQSACDGLDSDVKAFLVACDVLFEAYAQPGFDIESESVQALVRAVADAFAALDESSFDNVEVVEYYTRLEAAGLLPKDDIAAQIDFQVKMDRLENTSAVEAYSAGMGSKIQVFKLEHNSSANMGAGDVEYSDDYFRSYAILGLDAQDVNGTALGLDFSITASGETDRVNGNYIQQVYASTKSYDEIDALVNQIAQTDFATATYTMEDLLAEHFVELVGDNAAAPAGTRCYIVAYDVDAQGANVSARCDISVNIGGGDWTTAVPGTSVSYRFRGVTEPGNRVADPEDVDGIGLWQYSRVGGVEGDGVFVDDAVLNNGTVRLVARELSGTLSDENGVGMGDIALALFTYDAGTDAYTRLERDISGNRLADVLSADDGSYLFDKLPAGDYYIAMRGAGLNNKAAGAGMIKVTDRMHGLDGWTFVSEGAVSFKTLQQFNTDILLGSSEYVQGAEWSGQFEAGLPPYEVFVTWMDGQPGATLSEDKTHADWVVSDQASLEGVAKSFEIEIVVNEDIPAGTKLLTVPATLCKYDANVDTCRLIVPVDMLISTEFQHRFNESVIKSACENTSCLEFVWDSIQTTDVVSAGSHIKIPLFECVKYVLAVSRYRSSDKLSEATSYHYPSHSVDILGEKSYALVDGLGGEHELTFTRSASVESLLLYNNSTSNFGGKHVSGNLGNRVFSWTPLIESNYGVSKGAFDELVSDNKVLLEFVFRAVAKSNTLGYIDFDFVPSDNGQVVGVCAGIFSGRSVKSFFDSSVCCVPVDGDISVPFPYRINYYRAHENFSDVFYDDISQCDMYFKEIMSGIAWNYGGLQTYFNNGVSVLVAYDADEIFDEPTSTVFAGLDVTATLRSFVDDASITVSESASIHAPYTWTESDGDTYSLTVQTFGISSSGLSGLRLGLDVRHCSTKAIGSYKLPLNVESDNVSLAFDAIGLYSSGSRKMTTLCASDYVLSNIHFDVTPGKAYYSDTGELLNIEPDLDTYGEDVISVYVCTKDSPDVWVHDNDILLRDASKNYVPRNSNVCRVRLDYNGRKSFVQMSIFADITFLGKSSVIQSCIDDAIATNTSSLTINTSAALLSTSLLGDPIVVCPDSQVQGAWADGLHTLSKVLYSDCCDDEHMPLRSVYGYSMNSKQGSYWSWMISHFNNDDTLMTTYFASSLNLPNAKFSDLNDSIWLSQLNTAKYWVILPDSVDVVSIDVGIDIASTGSQAMYYTTNRGTTSYANVPLMSAFNVSPTVTYRLLDEDIDGFAVYEVVSSFPYDLSIDFKNGNDSSMTRHKWFGYFNITTCPKYTESFTTDDTRVGVMSYIIDPDSVNENAYSDSFLWCMESDGGLLFGYLPDDAGEFLRDMDRDGITEENILGRMNRYYTKTNNPAYISGLQLKAQGSSSRLFNTATTTSPTDPYRYKMTYQQAIEPSTNVVMYNSIEDISGNTWGGVLSDIDMSDADRQNITYTIYGNASRIDSLNYVQSKFNHENLRALEDGWFVIGSDTDLSTVKSIAIDFGSHEFQRDENNKPATVSVVYSMTPPAGGFAAGQTSIGNRAFFSDTLKGSGVTRTVMANQVTVTMDTEVGGQVSKTIVPVIRQGADGGISGDDMLTSVAESGTASQAGDVWVDTYDEAGNKITLDKTGKPADVYQYAYHLKYTMDDPGAGNYNSVRNVILYDNLENGTDSKYAGRLTDISVTGTDAFFAEFGQGHVPPGGGSGNGELVGGEGDDMEFLAMPFSLLPDNSGVSYTGLAGADVYVNYDGMSVSTNLPDGLVDATGIQDWTLLGSLSDGDVLPAPEGANIRHVAVVVSDLTTMHESGLNATPYQESYIDVALTMEHAGRTDCFGNDKIIRNGMLVSYQVPGVDDPVVVTLPSEQQPELEVIYRDTGFALPVTGGSGWFIPTVSGIGCIVLAASWIMSERKWRRRMAAVMAQQAGSEHDNQ